MSFIFNYEHIQCVRTNFIIAVTCRLVDLLTCRLESVRDWSGILLERSGKRYSGKPDGDSRNAQINS